MSHREYNGNWCVVKEPTNFVTVKNGNALLYRAGWNSPACTIASTVSSCILQNSDDILVTFKDGRTVLYRITPNRTSAVVVRSL